ncbi:TPA: hypothetical protein EYP70_01760 [Candidatus Bathyarchaeota archaeon]|nr:hypothetical protein [Candidatus Bathyarchaeota archaeon]
MEKSLRKVKAYATIYLTFPSEKVTALIYKSIKPETESAPTLRSKVSITKAERTITLTFQARDTTALRAAVNSYLRWIMLIDNTYKTCESFRNEEG